MIIRNFIVGLLILITLNSCDEQEFVSEIPIVFVEIDINLGNQQYLPLQQDGGWVYEDGGVRGLIIYRKDSEKYYAFERNCPFQPNEACATVEMHNSGFFMEDVCCGSVFDLEGFPTGGPARLPMKKYFTFLDGNFLYIRSDQ